MIRNIIWWSYERASWQWDVLCILIMAFIFLTPKAWFERVERPATQTPSANVQTAELSGTSKFDHSTMPAGN
jgi:hypothetical protein